MALEDILQTSPPSPQGAQKVSLPAPQGAKGAEPSPLDTDEIPIVAAAAALRPRAARTWTLGAVTTALLLFAGVTGLGLMFHYRPLPAAAHPGLVDLAEASRFGFVRELHRWSAHVLLAAVFVHLLRVLVTGAYRPPRRVNYLVGVVLFVLTLLLALTGWVLPWDENALWLLARARVDGDALRSIYALHCGVLPVVGALVVLYHLRRARRDDALTGEV